MNCCSTFFNDFHPVAQACVLCLLEFDSAFMLINSNFSSCENSAGVFQKTDFKGRCEIIFAAVMSFKGQPRDQ